MRSASVSETSLRLTCLCLNLYALIFHASDEHFPQDGADIILWTCGDGYADRWVWG